MRSFLKSSARWLSAAWFWPLVLLVLPDCGLDSEGKPSFEPGSTPTGLIMCDIPRVADEGATGCADSTDAGISRSYAAIALVQDEKSFVALDFSDGATSACDGFPKKTEFWGPYPDGYPACLNCGTQIPSVYADAKAVCVAKCIDVINSSSGPFPPDVNAYCQTNADFSTNFKLNGCFENGCLSVGVKDPDFDDPRRNQEPVVWIDAVDAHVNGNSVGKTTGPPTAGFTSGASSDQIIKEGDGWVEFEASEMGVSHVLGLSPDSGSNTMPELADVAFGISLNFDGNVNIVEGGKLVAEALEQYVVGRRYRVRVKDNNDDNPHTATVTYTRVDGTCLPAMVCSEIELATMTAPSPSYPLRVYARFREAGATLTNVTLVRIQEH